MLFASRCHDGALLVSFTSSVSLAPGRNIPEILTREIATLFGDFPLCLVP